MKEWTRRQFLEKSAFGGGILAGSGYLAGRRPAPSTQASDGGLVAWWRFEESEEGRAWEAVSQRRDQVSGRYRLVKGLEAAALKLDGFTTCVTVMASDAPRLSGAFTIEAWIALAAYPWNWCPIVSQQKEERAGYFFGIGPAGELGLQVSFSGMYYRAEWRSCTSSDPVPLKEWTHVAASFDEKEGIALYLAGEETARLPLNGTVVLAPDVDLLIGMNHEKRPASHPHREYSNLPAWYSLDGIVDEIKVHGRALTAAKVRTSHLSRHPTSSPDLPARVMPSGPPGPGRFGAYYTRLRYYEEWDALWRTGDYSDVVVRFDETPVRVVFWKGTSYSPAWVMEDGTWITDQSVEAWTENETYEHMNDARCLYSHVRVLESHEARAVVHWRYAPVNTRNRLWRVDEKTGMACWVDEYYTFYPDGVGVRHITWKRETLGATWQLQETLPLCHPGQRPEDIIHLDALTLMDMDGDRHTYSWPGDAESRRDLRPKGANIEVVNLKSKAKPFLIFEPGTRIQVLGGTIRKGIFSAFPMANHWPVALIPSDGRTCQAPDRPAHFSPAISEPIVHEDGEGETSTASWLWGATERTDELVELARSWTRPAELAVLEGDLVSEGYAAKERAWMLSAHKSGAAARLRLAGSPASPIVHPALVIKNWDSGIARLDLDGRRLKRGAEFRLGHRQTMEGSDLMIWVRKRSSVPIELRLSPL